jgi:hypothetical protein
MDQLTREVPDFTGPSEAESDNQMTRLVSALGLVPVVCC